MSAGRTTTGLYQPKVETGKLLAPEELGGEILNMEETEEGTLRSILGPTPWVPPAAGQEGIIIYPNQYGTMHGLFHHSFNNRDVLLMHSGDSIYQFKGWQRQWGGDEAGATEILGTSGSAILSAPIPDISYSSAPTQFEGVPNGIIIVPQQGRAYFFDGEAAGELGYSQFPAPPVGEGPNEYNHTTDNMFADISSRICFGNGRVGTLAPYTSHNITGAVDEEEETAGGMRLKGSYRAATQWIDRWGNLSPLSGRSGEVVIPQKNSVGRAWDDTDVIQAQALDWVGCHLLWQGIEPDSSSSRHTIGRVFHRTKDTKNSGSDKLYIVPSNAADGALFYATMPDNSCKLFPDNTPDEWLLLEATSPIPVPEFRYCKVAFGRLFIADKGTVRWSMPGRWGTFLEFDYIVPDPQGAEITGFANTPAGLLVFTLASVFLITPSTDGQSYIHQGISTSVGCVAPNSIAMMENGTTVWLGRTGFYASQGASEPQLISEAIRPKTRNINKARAIQAVAEVDVTNGEYRCWVPYEGSRTNSHCFIYDGKGWREADYMDEVVDLCVLKDHRHYMLACGSSTGTSTIGSTSATGKEAGVWLLDHEVFSYEPSSRTSKVRTGWVGSADKQRKSPKRITLWLRETQNTTLDITVYRDWRLKAIHTDSVSVKKYSTEDTPPFWGSTTADGSSQWKKRRPFWSKVDIHIPSCEVFSIEVSSSATSAWEFIGLQIEETLHSSSHRIPQED